MLALLLNVVGVFSTGAAHAAETSLTVSIPPELAYQVRQWRREHGLPQEPEASTTPPRSTLLADRRGAVDQALRLVGLDTAAPGDLQVAAQHAGSHWHVSIKLRGDEDDGGYEIDVADSIGRAQRLGG